MYAEDNPSLGPDFIHPCLEIWDCRGLGYDLGSLGLSIVGDSLIACTPVSGGLCGAGAALVKGADTSLTAAGALHAIQQYRTGNSSDLELSIALAAASMSLYPGTVEGATIVSLIWGLADPIVPDESWGSLRTVR